MSTTYGFSSVCSHVSALIGLYLEVVSSRIEHKYGLDESDREFIESMFKELARRPDAHDLYGQQRFLLFIIR